MCGAGAEPEGGGNASRPGQPAELRRTSAALSEVPGSQWRPPQPRSPRARRAADCPSAVRPRGRRALGPRWRRSPSCPARVRGDAARGPGQSRTGVGGDGPGSAWGPRAPLPSHSPSSAWGLEQGQCCPPAGGPCSLPWRLPHLEVVASRLKVVRRKSVSAFHLPNLLTESSQILFLAPLRAQVFSVALWQIEKISIRAVFRFGPGSTFVFTGILVKS